MSKRPFVVGLSGGIGSGKSTVADRFQARGAGIVDTDAIAHEITTPGGAAIAAIRARFGERYLNNDGSLNRAAMRTLVFSDAEAKKALENIMHPLIGAQVRGSVFGRSEPYLLLVVPLLFETGAYADLVDRVLIVDCPEHVQVERVMRRNALSDSEVRAIMATQLTREARLARADDIIDNGRAEAALETQVLELDACYRRLAAQRHERECKPQ